MTPESEVRRCLNHGKYICFHRIPRFGLIADWRVLREGLGSPFGRFLVTLGSILVVWEGPGNRLEFRWILGSPLEHPKSRGPGQVVVSVRSGGPTCYQLITNWLILKQLTAATRAGYQGFQQPGLDIRDSKPSFAAVCPHKGGRRICILIGVTPFNAF
jgi:hypothetical protein